MKKRNDYKPPSEWSTAMLVDYQYDCKHWNTANYQDLSAPTCIYVYLYVAWQIV